MWLLYFKSAATALGAGVYSRLLKVATSVFTDLIGSKNGGSIIVVMFSAGIP
jgi:hypothetical protein